MGGSSGGRSSGGGLWVGCAPGSGGMDWEGARRAWHWEGTSRWRAPGQCFAGAMGTQGLRSKVRCPCTALRPLRLLQVGALQERRCSSARVSSLRAHNGRGARGGRGATSNPLEGGAGDQVRPPRTGPRGPREQAGARSPTAPVPEAALRPARRVPAGHRDPKPGAGQPRGGDRPWVAVWHTRVHTSTEQRDAHNSVYSGSMLAIFSVDSYAEEQTRIY
ncbi:hypothetical protein HJG60_011659 [Phyllostomus discolor]|uniref:Uncharacterized protein n=1 Tax=Phyllostomus discolor TaxID=89673 RepID=A0A833ZW67_9CHIR|nr:hypothetical protein HJG60_011659 [Phyllostomus discolor]